MPDPYALILELRRTEGTARALAKLPHDFYGSTTTYLGELRRTFEADLRENPAGRKGELARQTYQRASQAARDIVEARMTKILTQAFQASVGGAREQPNLLPEERRLYESLVASLKEHRREAASFLEPTPPPAPSSAPERAASPASRAGPPPARAADASAGPPMVVVRVLASQKPMELGAETLELQKEDLLSLPPSLAQILVDGKIAERVDLVDRR